MLSGITDFWNSLLGTLETILFVLTFPIRALFEGLYYVSASFGVLEAILRFDFLPEVITVGAFAVIAVAVIKAIWPG